jgi:adenine-specific DNA-methyltransferase
MNDDLKELILSLVPKDGSAIGNHSLLAELHRRKPQITEADYWSVRDALVADGILGKGRGHGGSVYLVDGGG